MLEIIDSITHVTPDGRWFGSGADASETKLLNEMDASQVSQAFVVALAGYISNQFVFQLCQQHSDRLIPVPSFNPGLYGTPADAALALRSEIWASPGAALKLHPRLNDYDPLDPRCLAVLEEVASWPRPLPIWLDSLFYGGKVPLQRPLVESLHFIGTAFPSLNFVALHAGGTWALHAAEALRSCENMFLDLSFTLHRYADTSLWADLRYLVNSFDRRIVFGSDFPEISLAEALRRFDLLTEGLTAEKKGNMLSANLRRVVNS